jgi:hypothetical protein
MLLIIPITAALFAFHFIDVLRIPERWRVLYRKPFNCNLCLSFWVALLLSLSKYYLQALWPQFLLYGEQRKHNTSNGYYLR